MGRKPVNAIPVMNSLDKAHGLAKLKTISDIEKDTGLDEWQVRGAIGTAKKLFRRQGRYLRNARVGSKRKGDFRSGYYIIRLNNGNDIIPPEDSDFNAIKARFRSFIEVWQAVDWKALSPQERQELISMQNEMVKVITNW